MGEYDLRTKEVREVIRKAEYRKTLREPIVRRREEVSELMRPLREDWQEEVEGRPRGRRRYDGTAVVALDQAGASIYSMLTATDNQWAPLEFEDEWRGQDDEARAWLAEANRRVFRSLDPGRDNFYNDAAEVILDSIALGDGVFYSSRAPGSELFHSKAIPWRECCFDVGNFGEVTHFDRWYSEPLWNVAELFGREALPPKLAGQLDREPNARIDLLHSCYPNRGNNRISSVQRVASHYIIPEYSHELRLRGYREMPYFVSRWGVGSGQTYGMGRGVYALPDAQMVNEMGRTVLTAAQKAAEPPMAAHDELIGLIRMDPGYLNYGAVDDAGNPLVRPIQTGANIGITLEMQDQKRSAIKDAFYHAMLTLVGSPTPSVVEILKNDERRDQSMGPNLARVNSEFLGPFVQARYRELLRAGQIPPAPPAAAGGRLRVRFVSPLAKVHRQQAASATLNAVRGIAEVAQIDPRARYAIHGLRAARTILDGFAAPDAIGATEAEILEMMQAEQEQAQGAQALEVAERGGRAVESLARAQREGGANG